MPILVVDDSRTMRMIVLRELRKAGYETRDVLEAENGRAAFERIAEGGVELVLSDWNMPEMNGLDLLKALRRDGNDIPFGFVTSESTRLMHRDALDAGADFVVTKPFSANSLSVQVQRVLEGRRQSDGLGAAVAPENETLATILTGLLGRAVSPRQSGPPRETCSGVVARYRSTSEARRALFVAELDVAAAIGAALARIPDKAAAEYARKCDLPEEIEQNLSEVLNILSKLVPGYDERWWFEGMAVLPALSEHGEIWAAKADRWYMPLEVQVTGYSSGRVGFLGVRQ
jgi:CheY-like chemotaxis protein